MEPHEGEDAAAAAVEDIQAFVLRARAAAQLKAACKPAPAPPPPPATPAPTRDPSKAASRTVRTPSWSFGTGPAHIERPLPPVLDTGDHYYDALLPPATRRVLEALTRRDHAEAAWLYAAAPVAAQLETHAGRVEAYARETARRTLLRVLGPEHGATPPTAGTAHLPRPLRLHRAAHHAAAERRGPGAYEPRLDFVARRGALPKAALGFGAPPGSVKEALEAAREARRQAWAQARAAAGFGDEEAAALWRARNSNQREGEAAEAAEAEAAALAAALVAALEEEEEEHARDDNRREPAGSAESEATVYMYDDDGFEVDDDDDDDGGGGGGAAGQDAAAHQRPPPSSPLGGESKGGEPGDAEEEEEGTSASERKWDDNDSNDDNGAREGKSVDSSEADEGSEAQETTSSPAAAAAAAAALSSSPATQPTPSPSPEAWDELEQGFKAAMQGWTAAVRAEQAANAAEEAAAWAAAREAQRAARAAAATTNPLDAVRRRAVRNVLLPSSLPDRSRPRSAAAAESRARVTRWRRFTHFALPGYRPDAERDERTLAAELRHARWERRRRVAAAVATATAAVSEAVAAAAAAGAAVPPALTRGRTQRRAAAVATGAAGVPPSDKGATLLVPPTSSASAAFLSLLAQAEALAELEPGQGAASSTATAGEASQPRPPSRGGSASHAARPSTPSALAAETRAAGDLWTRQLQAAAVRERRAAQRAAAEEAARAGAAHAAARAATAARLGALMREAGLAPGAVTRVAAAMRAKAAPKRRWRRRQRQRMQGQQQRGTRQRSDNDDDDGERKGAESDAYEDDDDDERKSYESYLDIESVTTSSSGSSSGASLVSLLQAGEPGVQLLRRSVSLPPPLGRGRGRDVVRVRLRRGYLRGVDKRALEVLPFGQALQPGPALPPSDKPPVPPLPAVRHVPGISFDRASGRRGSSRSSSARRSASPSGGSVDHTGSGSEDARSAGIRGRQRTGIAVSPLVSSGEEEAAPEGDALLLQPGPRPSLPASRRHTFAKAPRQVGGRGRSRRSRRRSASRGDGGGATSDSGAGLESQLEWLVEEGDDDVPEGDALVLHPEAAEAHVSGRPRMPKALLGFARQAPRDADPSTRPRLPYYDDELLLDAAAAEAALRRRGDRRLAVNMAKQQSRADAAAAAGGGSGGERDDDEAVWLQLLAAEAGSGAFAGGGKRRGHIERGAFSAPGDFVIDGQLLEAPARRKDGHAAARGIGVALARQVGRGDGAAAASGGGAGGDAVGYDAIGELALDELGMYGAGDLYGMLLEGAGDAAAAALARGLAPSGTRVPRFAAKTAPRFGGAAVAAYDADEAALLLDVPSAKAAVSRRGDSGVGAGLMARGKGHPSGGKQRREAPPDAAAQGDAELGLRFSTEGLEDVGLQRVWPHVLTTGEAAAFLTEERVRATREARPPAAYL